MDTNKQKLISEISDYIIVFVLFAVAYFMFSILI